MRTYLSRITQGAMAGKQIQENQQRNQLNLTLKQEMLGTLKIRASSETSCSHQSTSFAMLHRLHTPQPAHSRF